MKKFPVIVCFFAGCMLISMKDLSSYGISVTCQDSIRSGQLVIVMTENWNNVNAKLYAFEKIEGKWVMQFSFPAVVGKNGLAAGDRSSRENMEGTTFKKEGDMKAPAGLFFLGPAFGYAKKSDITWIQIPYLQATEDLICVDDSNSREYNHLISKSSGGTDWKSHEEMQLPSDEYKWGMFVQYNINPVEAGRGSCIFLHVWDSESEGTAGCTAMEEKNILRLLHWLRSDKSPMLIQFPESEYRKISTRYQLPEL